MTSSAGRTGRSGCAYGARRAIEGDRGAGEHDAVGARERRLSDSDGRRDAVRASHALDGDVGFRRR
jgi:hypothetical protein